MRRVGPVGRLRALTAAVFAALALPAGVLVHQAWGDLRWQALHTQRVLAQELVARVDAQARALIAAENARPATDYAFLNLAGDPRANLVQRSPLAAFPPPADLPGVVGYFEVDARGRFGTPLLPPGSDGAAWGVPPAELAQRQALAGQVFDALARSRLVSAQPPPAALPPTAPAPVRESATRYAYEADAGGSADVGGRAQAGGRDDAAAARNADAPAQGKAADARPDAPAPDAPANTPAATPPDAAPDAPAPARPDRPAGVRKAEAEAAPEAGTTDPAPAPVGQAAFDALEARQRGATLGSLKADAPAALARKERSALPTLADADVAPPARAAAPYASFGAAAPVTAAPAEAPHAAGAALAGAAAAGAARSDSPAPAPAPIPAPAPATDAAATRAPASASDRESARAPESAPAQRRAAQAGRNAASRASRTPTPQPPPRPQASAQPASALPSADATAPVRLFESEVDPLVLGRLHDGPLLLYRRVWRDGARSVQGVLLDPDRLLAGLVGAAYRESAVARSAALEVGFQGDVLAGYAPAAGASLARTAPGGAGAVPGGAGAVLLETTLAAPLDAVTLRFTARHLPPGPGAGVVAWTALALAVVLVGGLGALYALGARALGLAQAQRDFVTRVSHELRTPLTAIRMYGEMLVHGWADDTRRAEYHRYIHDEAQRLSRLIESVLSFGRASRDELRLTLTPVTVGELTDLLRSRLNGPVQAAGFTLHVDCPDAVVPRAVAVDADAFTQVLVNLTDNALKFAASAEHRVVDVSVRADAGWVRFTVRDHGPGLSRRDLERAFRPFYRARSAAATPGTGIGLALSRALAQAMGGRLEARNAQPGAAFVLTLPARP